MNDYSSLILPILILAILTFGVFKKVPVYEEFINGAKDGFKVSISIIPYLVGLIVAISMLRASGFFDNVTSLLGSFLTKLHLTGDILPLVLTRPLSGSGALGIFSELANTHGADSFITKTAAIMIGSSETTFYVLAVYFGSIGIKKYRYSILTGVLADIISFVLAVWVAHLFFLPNIV